MSLLLACLISLRASWTCIGASAHVQPFSSPAFHCLSGQLCRKYPASFKLRGEDAGRQAHLVKKPASPDSSCAVSMPPRIRMMVSNTEAS